jgi:hypothetical protein
VAERWAARRQVRDAEDREAGRAERVPAPRLPPRHPRSAGSPAWYRTGRGQLIIGGGAIALAVILRVLVPGGGSNDQPGPPLGLGLPHYGNDWSGAHGTRYRISVTPLPALSSKASADGCVPAPSDGFVNATFGVRIENLSGKAAPVPDVDFGSNLDASGSADPTMVALPSARTNVSLAPAANHASCRTASSISPDGRKTMSKGSVLDLVGTIGGISIPVEPGLAVILRYTSATGSEQLLAPYLAFPVGS